MIFDECYVKKNQKYVKLNLVKSKQDSLLGVTCYVAVAFSPGSTGDVDMKEATYVGKV